ncbi:MAG: acetyl-CoA hydrolase/transferase family protein [Hyphomicrobiaceae bacterium]
MAEEIDLAGLLRPGDRLAWSAGPMEPSHLLGLLDRQLDRVPTVSVLLNISLEATLNAVRLASRATVTALGGAVTNRRFQEVGALDVLPVNYSALPDLMAGGRLPIDVVLLQLAADGGAFNLSLMVDHLADAAPRARAVVAEINDQLPLTYGETRIEAAHIDHAVHVSRSLLEVPSRPSRAIEREIAAHVCRLVGDGATLQIGLGALPDAVLESFSGKRDLGLHSGTIGDRTVDLVEAGVITNRKKPIDTGKCVTGTLLGSQRLYRWAHRNPLLEMRSPRYTHDILVHATIPKLTGINTALEVDLTGQMNAEVAGKHHVGMIGGHSDFMRGCLKSPGGRGIIVMEATARHGAVSRVVPRLSGGIVTTARSDADTVVTEYGIAELHGRSVSERARQLIAIAHPGFRKALSEAASEGLM